MSAECSECGADVTGPDFTCFPCQRGKLLDQVRADVREIAKAAEHYDIRNVQDLVRLLHAKLEAKP